MEALPDIAPFERRLAEFDAQMSAPDFYSDQRKAAEVAREHQRVSKIIELHNAFTRALTDMNEHEELLADPAGDAELKELAEEELPALRERAEQLYNDALVAMIPPEASDARNTVVEIRAGAGGDEASLFAGDLYRMYTRFAETRGWKVESMGMSESEVGGFKEVAFLITGEDVYKQLKFESGVHRVQRVPVTEAGGRIHTSTVTVAVLPEAEAVDVQIDPNDLDISATRASGAGGQHVNTTDSAIQITHKPTGLMVYCADERSQLKNKNKALKVLYSRLLKMKEDEEREKYAAQRKSQVGTGDRSERIRTYNFPQSRLTDHRIGESWQSLPQIMEGQIDDVIEKLLVAREKEKLEELFEDVSSEGNQAPRRS